MTALLAAGLSALALGACGSDADDASSSPTAAAAVPSTAAAAPPSSGAPSNEQDGARVRLTQCLRDNGVDVPDNPGPGLDVDQDKLQEALDGPCKEFQAGAFGDPGGSDLQEFRDAFAKFAECMRKNGVDVPDLGPNDGPAQTHGLFDPSDPKVQAGQAKCQDKFPQNDPGAGL